MYNAVSCAVLWIAMKNPQSHVREAKLYVHPLRKLYVEKLGRRVRRVCYCIVCVFRSESTYVHETVRRLSMSFVVRGVQH